MNLLMTKIKKGKDDVVTLGAISLPVEGNFFISNQDFQTHFFNAFRTTRK